MNSFDLILIIIISLFTIRGVFRGLITELTVLIALIAGYVLAFRFMDNGVLFLQSYFPLLQEFAVKIIAFVAIFLIVNIVLRLLAKVLNKFASFTFLQPINKIAGGIFGAAKVMLLVSIAFIILEFLPFSTAIRQSIGATESFLYKPLRAFAPGVYKIITAVLPEDSGIQDKLEQTIQKADSTAKEYVPPIF